MTGLHHYNMTKHKKGIRPVFRRELGAAGFLPWRNKLLVPFFSPAEEQASNGHTRFRHTDWEELLSINWHGKQWTGWAGSCLYLQEKLRMILMWTHVTLSVPVGGIFIQSHPDLAVMFSLWWWNSLWSLQVQDRPKAMCPISNELLSKGQQEQQLFEDWLTKYMMMILRSDVI